jgi:DNA-binding CsgD family transcriptional regulator
MLTVQLRAAFQLARMHLERGDLADASKIAHQGLLRAEEAGLAMAPYGLDLQYTHYLAHYADGDWDHAQRVADGFDVRVTSVAEARLSAMALFIDVARGSPVVSERIVWMRPFWPLDGFAEYIARGLMAEHALWQGNAATAAAEASDIVRLQKEHFGSHGPPTIRVAALGISGYADVAARARAGGDAAAVDTAVAAAADLVEAAREGAAYPRRPRYALGIEGRAWLARAEAEWRRAQGDNDPQAWQTVIEEFGPSFVYESARSRWRLAEAFAEAGQRDEAQREWRLAMDTAQHLDAAQLRDALRDLARRARLDTSGSLPATRPAGAQAGPGPGGRPAPQPGPGLLSGLTAREREVLRLLASGSSNKEIGSELFIAPKTASVHVSNILAKLGAASRTEAAAIAHRNGVGLSGRPGR